MSDVTKMIQTQRLKAETFRSLHTTDHILILPNAWDAASARIFEEAGFPCVATTSAGIAFTLGYADGQIIPRDEMLFMLRRIVQTVTVPVSADIEAGYGNNSVEQVLTTVRGVLSAGAIGINLEDAEQGEIVLTDIGLQCEKIQAIRALGQSEDIPLVINARTDAFHLADLTQSAKFTLAVERLNAYRAAGADCLFAPFVTESAVIADLVKAVDGPLNILAVAGSPTVAELEQLGVARVSIGGGPCRASLGLARRIAAELRDFGTYAGFMDGAIPYAEVNQLFASRE